MANEVVKVPLEVDKNSGLVGEDDEKNLDYCKCRLEEDKASPDVVKKTLETNENKWWFQPLMLLFLHLTLLCIVFQVFLQCPTWSRTMVGFAVVQVMIIFLVYLMRHYRNRNMSHRKNTFTFLLVFSATELIIYGFTLPERTETEFDRCYMAVDDILLFIILAGLFCAQLVILACTQHPCWYKLAFKYNNYSPSVS
ncbi:hypothetical protein SNE40_017395 [Patella caerulea]|uniref:Uncharacterized protein n=1 Tax=Patella caerulea TaxID=87958 RepID=A0AAN8JH11_PATCE